MAGGGGFRGATAPPPNIWKISKPYSNRGGQIIPTYYYWHPQCFSPSGITDLYACFHENNNQLKSLDVIIFMMFIKVSILKLSYLIFQKALILCRFGWAFCRSVQLPASFFDDHSHRLHGGGLEIWHD